MLYLLVKYLLNGYQGKIEIMRERDNLTSEKNVLIVKLLGAPTHLINGLSLPFFNMIDNVVVFTLRPNFDLIRRKASSQYLGETRMLVPLVLNLVFDPAANDQITAEWAPIIAGTQMAHCNARHLGSIEEFSTFIVTLGLPELRLPENFWMPVQSILTVRELEILSLVYQGLSSKKIAEYLGISNRTIELHRQNCSAKLFQITPILLETLYSTKALETYYWGILNGKITDAAQHESLA